MRDLRGVLVVGETSPLRSLTNGQNVKSPDFVNCGFLNIGSENKLA
jgi:hypothetical protein